ncbi:caspase domain-containing protein [Amylostereum chailletii]|nr:caspase domain-containing protein [Amylostereum chailletii]
MYTALPDMSYDDAEWERRRLDRLSRIDRGRVEQERERERERQEREMAERDRLAQEREEREETERLHRERSGKENGAGHRGGVQRVRAPRRRALLVGICYGQCGESGEYRTLKGPHHDVCRFRKMLIDLHHYRKEDIVVMIDRPNTPSHLVPTKKNMVRELQDLVKGAQHGDRFVFVFSGHSDQQEQSLTDNDEPEEDGNDEVIITSDDQKIVDNDLRKWLVNPLPSGSGLTAVIDSCHSGTMLDLPHRLCNGIYVPWVSRGKRRTGTMHNRIVRRAGLHPDFPPISSVTENKLDPNRLHAGARGSKGPLHLDTHGLPPSYVAALTRSPLSAIQGPLLSQVFTTSPVCESPDSTMYCTGYCSVDGQLRESKADVISLSACNDMQRAWEDERGRSMISILCDYLTHHHAAGHRGPSYQELMTHLNYKLHDIALRLHEWTRKEKQKAKGSANAPPVDGEMVNFQTPELSSLVRLNMEDHIQF